MEHEFHRTFKMELIRVPFNLDFRSKRSLSPEELETARNVMMLTLESTDKLINRCSEIGKPLNYRMSVKDYSDKLSNKWYHANVFTADTGYPFFVITDSVGDMKFEDGSSFMKCLKWVGDEDFLLGAHASSTLFHIDGPLAFPTRITVRTC